MSREKPKDIWFPKKSHHGYFDLQLQQRFSDKKEKRDFMHKNGIIEGDSATPAHMKRVREFNQYTAHMREKHGKNWRYKGEYPD